MGRFLNIVCCSLALLFLVAAFAQSAMADSLTITYTVKQNQTAVVGPGFTVVGLHGFCDQ
jgi:hypothetical protein